MPEDPLSGEGGTKAGSRMPNLSRRHFVIGCVCAAASAVAYAREPRVVHPGMEEEKFEKMVPDRFDGWRVLSESGVILPPPDALSNRLYDNLVTRVYRKDDATVMLLLAYNNVQDGVLQVHRPEVCYPVGGFALSETRHLELPIGQARIPANMFTATGPNRVEQVMYFTRLGDDFPRSWIEQRLSVMKSNVQGEIPDGMMMRFSVTGSDREQAVHTLTAFAQGFIAGVPARLRHLLIG